MSQMENDSLIQSHFNFAIMGRLLFVYGVPSSQLAKPMFQHLASEDDWVQDRP